MASKPVRRRLDDYFQCSRFIEQVSRSRHDFETRLAAQQAQSFAIEFENFIIQTTDDQQRRRFDLGQSLSGEIRAAAAPRPPP
jgi:hypothetical protein